MCADFKTVIRIAINEFILNSQNTFLRKNERIQLILFFKASVYSHIRGNYNKNLNVFL